MKLEGQTAAGRRLKAYLIELKAPDLSVEIDEDGDIEFSEEDRIMTAPAIGHGPEQAIRMILDSNMEAVESIRRMKSAGLLRAILTPDDMDYDYQRGQLEDQVEQTLNES